MVKVDHLMSGRTVPARIEEVIQNLKQIFGANLAITSVTDVEVTFSVRNLTDKQLISNMMQKTTAIFGTSKMLSGGGCVLGPGDFQILVAQTASSVSQGLLMRYLPNMPDRADYLSGFWFY
jgi:hypothetical protein